MKVLIVNNMVPFVWGGAEELAVHLQKNIVIAGHEAEILRIPFQWDPAEHIPSQMMIARTLELYNVDHVIALKFPAFYIRHPKKTIWLLHQYRQAYDLFDAKMTNLHGEMGNEVRSLIIKADNEALGEADKIYTISETVQERLLKYNGFQSTVLTPPVNDPEKFTGGKMGDYIFAAGRINNGKRQHMLIEALKNTDPAVKLLIAGPPDTPEDGSRLKKMVEQGGLGHRVQLDLRFLPREIYASYVNNAAAVAYIPYDEDCMSYVATEAAMARKPVITRFDSGGVLGLVKHAETGWVVNDDFSSLSETMNAVFKNKKCIQQYGDAAHEYWLSLGVNWANTVETLLR